MDFGHQLTTIFCEIDDFCKELDDRLARGLLTGPSSNGTTIRGPQANLTQSEIATILIMFQTIRVRDFKTFYIHFLQKYWREYFPQLPSYQRFVALMRRSIFLLTLFVQIRSGRRNNIYYIDSSCLPVCHIKRSKCHRTFEEVAKYGKTSVGWFFGLKIHLVVNDKGEIIAFKMTSGNRHDNQCAETLLMDLQGVAFGDKGYLGKPLFNKLLENGLKLITRKRKNMKGQKLDDYEQQLLNQRNIIETIFDHLKHHYQIWHTRHRSIWNAMTHLVAALAAYVIEPLKISAIKLLTETHY